MEIVEVARIDVARSLCSKEEKDMRAHWWHLGVPLSVFAGLHVDAAYQYRSNAVLRPHGHVDKGAGLQACTLVPVVGDEKVTLTMLSRVFPGCVRLWCKRWRAWCNSAARGRRPSVVDVDACVCCASPGVPGRAWCVCVNSLLSPRGKKARRA